MNEINEAWRAYRGKQAQRRRERVPQRKQQICAALPPGFTAQEVNNGCGLRICGPNGFKLVFYPVHEKIQMKGEVKYMQTANVISLLRKVAAERGG